MRYTTDLREGGCFHFGDVILAWRVVDGLRGFCAGTASAGIAFTLAFFSIALLTIRRIMRNSEKGLHPMGKQTTGQPLVASTGWRWVGERGLRVETGAMTLARYNLLISKNLTDVEDIIPADGSLLLILRRTARVSSEVRAALSAPLDVAQTAVKGKRHEIVVDYGGAAGPDLPALAKRAGMNVAAYIDCHAATEYTVAFLGFQPGFPYLQGLPLTLQAARRASPRQQVAAGSVAIGGRYTGIYPTGGPGGWHVIGRTDTVLFDPQRAAPALLMPGDRVCFVPA